MAFEVNRQGILGDINLEIARHETLLADLRNIAAGRLPIEAELGTAPLLDLWTMGTAPVPILVGDVHGHPLLRGPVIRTTDIQVFAPELGWARTLSRFYRLGRPVLPSPRQARSAGLLARRRPVGVGRGAAVARAWAPGRLDLPKVTEGHLRAWRS